ncbi:uncharacterized protein LOC130053769 [Ostrea edulis]|uniref:uncharacterized protein LOC130053769 n=1 Tax=Ostrea edulis TaxID=37623 RepID=UPI0024AEA58E|nr:uncharacterized protein LOC130053769 [Ostrea edulis]
MGDTIDFHLVEEAIKQNKHSIRLQEAVCLMIKNRAHAELTYLQEIESWKAKYQNELPKEVGGKDVFDFFKSAPWQETHRLAEIHRCIYDQLMANSGPYQKILKHIRRDQELKEIEDEFRPYDIQRDALENAVQIHKQSLSNLKALLIDLEEKLSRKNKRRSAKGTAKLESIITQVSRLQERIKTTSQTCIEDERELQNLINRKKKTLQIMFQELKELDKGRFSVIIEVISEFVKHVIPQCDLIHESADNTVESFKNLQTINFRKMYSHNWIRVAERAKLKKAGFVTGVDMFLVTNPSVQPEDLDLHVTGELMRTRKRQMTPPHHSVSQKQPDIPQKEMSTNLANSTTTCSSLNTVLKNGLTMKFPSPLVVEYSEDEIETIELPEESSCRLPNPFHVKEFCVLPEDDHPCSRVSGDCSVASNNDHPDTSENSDIGRLRDIIRVVAHTNYKAQRKNELSLNKGQVIKQIKAFSEEGFAYGYTRRNKLSLKRYGWYPISVVSIK